ncbi:Wzz/FepE/Etk N-terminal domain-containing protein [Thermus sediminis]|uniref:Wzz/FepE/Etk N-terminal domain-containing protein n=1 Tax=Thermus sediminis TaxID=1761908 RepID=UPI0022B7DB76|nr:Wzz/FepE/Etk N-terminal domain-containing protein [Thermus sediminis]
MVETPQEELSLRDIVEVLKRHLTYLWAIPLILAALALIYGFLIAEPTYASTATLAIGSSSQQVPSVTFESVKDVALSQGVLGPVWEALDKEGELPLRWRAADVFRGADRLRKDFSLKDMSNRGAGTTLWVRLTVKASEPEVAARAANLWADAVKREVDAFFQKNWQRVEEGLRTELTLAEEGYRQALERRQSFMRKTTLLQDRVELDFIQGIQISGQQAILLTLSNAGGDEPYGERLRILRRIYEIEDRLTLAEGGERQALLAEKKRLELQLQRLEERIRVLQERIAQAEEELAALDEAVARAKEIYLALNKQASEIRLARSQGEWASVLAPAYPVYEKVAPRRGLFLALALGLGLMLGVMAAFVAEALRPKGEPAPA